MAVANPTASVDQIGETAGRIWHLLKEVGPCPVSKLVKEVDSPRDLVMQAVGWLAREGKISIDEESRSKIISLR